MLTDKTNKVGYCCLCDAQIYESHTVYPVGHPWRGQIRTPADPLDNCCEATLRLLNKSVITVTVCTECAEKADDWDLNELHQILINSWRQEQSQEFRERAGLRPQTDAQREAQKKWLLSQLDNPPVEVIYLAKVEADNA